MRRDVTAMILSALEYQGASYVVIRGTNSRQDGKWINVEKLETRLPISVPVTESRDRTDAVLLRPTGEVERRDDGMLAAVVRPTESLEDLLEDLL